MKSNLFSTIKPKTKEYILNELDKFINYRHKYHKLGIPHRLAILLNNINSEQVDDIIKSISEYIGYSIIQNDNSHNNEIKPESIVVLNRLLTFGQCNSELLRIIDILDGTCDDVIIIGTIREDDDIHPSIRRRFSIEIKEDE